jgi:hypothetical protein
MTLRDSGLLLQPAGGGSASWRRWVRDGEIVHLAVWCLVVSGWWLVTSGQWAVGRLVEAVGGVGEGERASVNRRHRTTSKRCESAKRVPLYAWLSTS